LKGKRELQDKEQELEKVGNEHQTKWNHLSERHRQMDDMVKERIRRMNEVHDAQKEGERKQLEITQENNPSLRRLADEIESARGDLTIIVNKHRAAQQQLTSKEAAAQKSREEYSRTIKELKLRQGMGAGSFDPAHVHEERLPGARTDVPQLVDINGIKDLSQKQLTQVFHFLSNTGFCQNIAFYGRGDEARNLLAGRSKVKGKHESLFAMRLRLAKALTPIGTKLPEWASAIERDLHVAKENVVLLKDAVGRKVTKTREEARQALYSPRAFVKTKKRLFEVPDTSYEEPVPSSFVKRARTGGKRARTDGARPPLVNLNDYATGSSLINEIALNSTDTTIEKETDAVIDVLFEDFTNNNR